MRTAVIAALVAGASAFHATPAALVPQRGTYPQVVLVRGHGVVVAARSRISFALRMSEDSKDGGAPPAPKAMPSLDELAEGQGAAPGAKETSEKEEEKPAQYAVKLDKSGAGFNQFDPVLSATSFVSRRFGLVGGLAVVALLASTEGKDIVKALLAEKAKEGTGEVFETENGVEYEDLLVGPPGEGKEPAVGKLVGMTVEVTIADQKFKKNVAFKYGSKPYTSLVCEGLEEGIEGMRVGGRRKMTIPLEMAPKGMRLPPGVALVYDVTLNEVFDNYLN